MVATIPATGRAGGADRTRKRAAQELAANAGALAFAITWGLSVAILVFPREVQVIIGRLVANLMGDAHLMALDVDTNRVVAFVAVAAIFVLAYGVSLQGRRR